MIFYIIDAFAEEVFEGNPAGVLIYENLDESTMQKFAREMNFSETVFVKLGYNNNFNVRYFTPTSEIDFCGHATLAAYHALLDCGLTEEKPCHFLNNSASQYSIFRMKDYIMMEQALPSIRETLYDKKEVLELCDCLNISINDIGDRTHTLSPQIVYTGLYDIIFPVKDKKTLNNINPNFNRLTKFSQEKKVVGVHAFTLDDKNFTANCRNFAPLYGINEESATGSSSGALAYYLLKNKIIDSEKEYLFSQGEIMNRPSKILCKILSDKNNYKVLVGGKCKTLLKCNVTL